VIFFSGFSLQGEAGLFDDFLGPFKNNPYVVAGFSYGAIKAVEYATASSERIDRLLLLSPAWFVDKSAAFKRAQLLAFGKDREAYLRRFLESVAHPCKIDMGPYLSPGSEEDLKTLLTYDWSREKLQVIAEKGTVIETYLGGEDRIVNGYAAHEFFKAFSEYAQ